MQNSSRTQDVISGRLALWQHQKGYRYGLDALLLATDLPCTLRPEASVVLELGAGQGAVGLSIASRHIAKEIMLVERNPSMLGLLRDNITHNQELFAETSLHMTPHDLRECRAHLSSHCADLVVCNPPYFPDGHRRVSAHEERADAHHERHGGLSDFVSTAAYVLKHRGWLKMIIPPWRLADVYAAVTSDLKVLSLRFIHAEPGQPAYLMEVVMRRGGGPDLEVRAPLYVRGADGFYTEETAQRVAQAAHVGEPSQELVARVRDSSDKRRGRAS